MKGSSTTSRSPIIQQQPTTRRLPPVNPPQPPVIRTTTTTAPPQTTTTTPTAAGNIPNKEPRVQTPDTTVLTESPGDGSNPNRSGRDPETPTPPSDGSNGDDMGTPTQEDNGNVSMSFVRHKNATNVFRSRGVT